MGGEINKKRRIGIEVRFTKTDHTSLCLVEQRYRKTFKKALRSGPNSDKTIRMVNTTVLRFGNRDSWRAIYENITSIIGISILEHYR